MAMLWLGEGVRGKRGEAQAREEREVDRDTRTATGKWEKAEEGVCGKKRVDGREGGDEE